MYALIVEKCSNSNSTDDENLKKIASFVHNLITCSSKIPGNNAELIKHTYTCKDETKKKHPYRFSISFYRMDCILLPVDDEEFEKKMEPKINEISRKINENI